MAIDTLKRKKKRKKSYLYIFEGHWSFEKENW